MRAATHSIPNAQPNPHAIESSVCQSAIGSVDAVTRKIMTNGIAGGTKLAMVASMPFGFSIIGIHSMIGITSTSITGPTSDCASRRSLTALPTAAIIDATMKYAITKNTTK